jgi:hypothetical protein
MDNYKPPFTISEAMLTFVASIMEKIGLVNNYDNLSKFPHLRKNHRIRSIHSSCAIEANSLSLDQVSDVIDGIKVIGPEKDIIEIQNIIEAYRCIEKVDPLNESELKQINGIIGRKVIKDAGSYRKGNQGVADEYGNIVFIAPPPRNVPILMAKLFGFITANYNKIHPLILSSIFHYELEAKMLANIPADESELINKLKKLGAKDVIITLGARGGIYTYLDSVKRYQAYKTKAKDTTGAGDAFVGSVAASLTKSVALPDAIKRASYVAGITVTRFGAQQAIPSKEEIDALFEK